MAWIKAWVAGFIATLLFHQGLLGLLHLADASVPAPYNMAATAPFGVPAVISLAFWGGVWGVLLWALIRPWVGVKYWVAAAVIGAIGPSAVALLVVMPLKGMAVAGGGNLQLIAGALLLNAAWGLGTALCMRLAGAAGARA